MPPPPLRDRGPDIASLAQHFLARYCEENGRRPKGLAPAARNLLSQYSWPGNVRELRNMMERVVIMVDEDEIDAAHLRQAMIMGSVMASFNVEAFSVDRLRTLTMAEIEARFTTFRRLVHFDDLGAAPGDSR